MKETWKPFVKQEIVLSIGSSVFEILFGGARGGGKTDAGMVWLLGDNISEKELYINHPRYRALVVRKNYDDLVDWIDRASHMYQRYGAVITGKPAVVKWPSGAKFRLGHLKDRSSYEKYLGHEYQRELIEELTLIPREEYYIKILGSCRSTVDVLKPQVFCTTNPGEVGHLWVKQRFIDPAPYGEVFEATDGRKRVYIPATIEDNPALMKDKGYVKYLDGLKLTDPDLYRAWRLGDWDVFAGQYFKEFRRNVHTTDYFEPQDDLVKFAGIDWGHSPRPFVFLAAALEKVDHIDKDLNSVKFNRLWIYREVHGIEKTPHEWAKVVKKSVDLKQFNWIRGDPSMHIKKSDGSRSIAKQFKEKDITILPANNDRVNGWIAIRNWLSIAPDGLPYLIIGNQCHNLITNIPSLVHDENKPDDLDTDGMDDEADALRYMVIHVKWIDAGIGTVTRPKAIKRLPQHVYTVDPTKFS